MRARKKDRIWRRIISYRETARDQHLNLKMRLRGRYLEGPGGGKGCELLNHFGSNQTKPGYIKKIFQMDTPGSNFWIAGNLFRSVDLIIRLMNSTFLDT